MTHTYDSTGTYTIKFTSGRFKGFQFNNAGDKLKITGISKWGNVRFGDVYPDFPNGVFMGCTNLATITATDTPHFTGMTNLYSCFRDCTSLVSINNIQNWNLSTITNLYGMFTYDTSYDDPNIGQLNVSGVTDFSSMFFGCSNFNQDIGAWDTSNATLLTNTFFNCAKFNNGGSDSIKNWDTSNVTNMLNMFRGCTVFNQDISDWDVSSVTDMSTMFMGATNFINGNLAMCLPNKGTAGMSQYCQINVSPAIYNGVTLSAASSTTDTNLKFYASKTSVLAQAADNLSGKIRIVTVSDYPTLSKVRFTTTGTLPANLALNTDYWIVKYAEQHSAALTCPSYRIATSYADAVAGTFINYSNAGSGTHTVIEQDSADGWVLGLARTQYYPNGYDNAGVMTLPASGKWYTRWVYRELSAANKNVFYVSGKNVYDTPEEAEAEIERTDLPTHLTNSCVLVGRIIQQWSGNNGGLSICSVISRRLGATDGIGSWNVAKVTTMSEMFSGAKMFDIPLSWNAAACTNFYRFMYDCRNFNQSINSIQINPLGVLSGIELKQWMQFCRNWNNGQVCYRTTGTSPVTINLVGVGDCDSAFKDLIAFNQNMDALNLSTATQLGGFIMYGTIFNNGQAVGGTTAPLLWSAVRSSHFQYMLADCQVFNQDISTLLENFVAADLTFAATGGVATITRAGHGLTNGASVVILGSSNETMLPNGTYTIAGVTTNTFTITAGSGTGSGTAVIGARTDYMFRNATVFNRDLSKWDVSGITNMSAMFNAATAFNNGANTDTNVVTGRSGLDGWDVSNATTMGDMFNGATVFNRPLANWNVGKVTNMVSTFKQTAFNQDIGNWNTVSVTNMGYMFNDCPFNQDIGIWNVSNCTVFQGMFSTTVPSTFNQDLSQWDVGKCVDFQYMFRRCFAFNNGVNTRVNPITGRSGIDGWNIGSNVATPSILMLNMFWSNSSNMGFNRNIGSWDMSKVTNISGMFRLCTSFNQDVRAWNTAQVTNMFEAFYNCSALKQNFGAWNVTACTNFTSMFYGCNLNDTGTTTNYDALLVGWAAQAVQNSKSFHGGTSQYSDVGQDAKAILLSLDLWTITDGGTYALNYWKGTTSTNWNTAANWSQNRVPLSTDVVYFVAAFNNPCTINANAVARLIEIQSGYTSTITQGAFTITVGVEGWQHHGGAFNGSATGMTFNGPFVQDGGTFNAGSQTITIATDIVSFTGGTFNNNNGKIHFTGGINSELTLTGSPTLYDCSFDNTTGASRSYNILTSITVQRNLLLNETGSGSVILRTGTVNAQGNIAAYNTGAVGTGTIEINGIDAQQLAGTLAGAFVPNININKGSGTLTIAQYLKQSSGVWRYTAGTVDSGTSTLEFQSGLNNPADIYGTQSLNNIILNKSQAAMGEVRLNGATVTVLGNFTVNNSSAAAITTNNGTWMLYGNATFQNGGALGSAAITFSGSSNQTLSQNSQSVPSGTVTLNKTSGTVTLASALTINAAGQTLAIQSGTLDMAGYNLTATQLTITGGELIQSTGTLTTASYTQSGGTFNGGANGMTLNGLYTLSGGTFNAGSQTINSFSNMTFSGGTFNADTSTVYMRGYLSGNYIGTITGTPTFYNLSFQHNDPFPDNYTIANTVTVSNTLTVAGSRSSNGNGLTFLTGTIDAKGAVTLGSSFNGGTATLKFSGTGDQTLTTATTTHGTTTIPNMKISKASGALSFAGNFVVAYTFLNENLGGTVNAGTSSVTFGINSGGYGHSLAGSTTFYSLTLGGYNCSQDIGTGTTFTVTGSFSASSAGGGGGSFSGGALVLQGDVSGTIYHGTTAITLSGTAAQSINITSRSGSGAWTINKSGGTATLAAALSMSGTSLTVTAGILDLAGYDLSGSYSIGASGTLKLQGGETVTTPTSNSGTVEYAGASSYTLKNWTYQDLVINGSGGTFTLAAALVANGNLTVTAGTLSLAGYNLTASTTFNIGASGTLKLQGGETVTTPTSNSGTVEYTGTSSYTLKNWTYQNLTINGSGGTFTAAAALVANSNLTVTAGTLQTVKDSAGNVTIGNTLLVTSTMLVRRSSTTGNGAGQTISAVNITINGTLHANGEGFNTSAGPGYQLNKAATYGGVGGGGNTVSTYGSISAPTALGSSAANGLGGGAIILSASGTVAVNGTLSVNGITVDTRGTQGSGGSIDITASTLTGAGTISANGGSAPGGDWGTAYGGGGGRISLNGVTTDNFSGTLQSNGGSGFYDRGYAGTIYLNSAKRTSLTLGGTGNLASLRLGTDGTNDYTFGSITIQSGGTLQVDGNPLLDSGNGSAATINVTTLDVQSGGSFNATSLGQFRGTGYQLNAGGTYGGQGANSTAATYGSSTAPVAFGSGANVNIGGGAVIINASSTVAVNGTISSSSTNNDNRTPAGSGGSVYIRTTTLSGSGTISANGGSASSGDWALGYGGGGGRVSIIQSVGSAWTPTITANGGTGVNGNGAVGTVNKQNP